MNSRSIMPESSGDHDVTGLLLFNRKMNESSGGAIMDFPAYEEDWVGRVTYNYKGRYLAKFNRGLYRIREIRSGKTFRLLPFSFHRMEDQRRTVDEEVDQRKTQQPESEIFLRYGRK